MTSRKKPNGDFTFLNDHSVSLVEQTGNMTREPWLMLLARQDRKPEETLCWGLTHTGASFARIGTQEGDLVNGFVHEDPYKVKPSGPFIYFCAKGGKPFTNCWYPVLREDQRLETVFSFGSLSSKTACEELEVVTENFIPRGADAMVQLVTITNTASELRRIAVSAVNPVNIGDARDIQFSGFNTLMMGGGMFDPDLGGIVWRSHFGVPFGQKEEELRGMFGKVLVHTASREITSWSTKYEDFIGHHSASLANPAGASADTLASRSCEELTSALSAVRFELTLNPGETQEFTIVSIAVDSSDYYCGRKHKIADALAACRNPLKARAELDKVRLGWKEEFSRLSVSVPQEADLAPSFRWLQYQCAMVASLNRMKSRFHSGFEYGFGFRDILQDLLALLPLDPARVGETLAYVGRQMFSDGSAYHNFYVSAPGNRDFNACDDPLWFVYAACEYVRESGDFAWLERTEPYADEKEGMESRSGTMLERCNLAVDRVWAHSKNGFPILYAADWNDDLSGYPEHLSVMAAQMLFKACNDLAELIEECGARKSKTANPVRVAELLERARITGRTFREHAIGRNGKITRLVGPGFDHSKDLGSDGTDALTFFEPVAWAGYSGIATKEEFLAASEHAERDLLSKAGYAICQGDTSLASGIMPDDDSAWRRNAPGKKENGGAFRHLESWYIASLCEYGFGSRAWKIYRDTLPAVSSADDPWTYAAERFVYPEYVSGKASIEYGRAGHTWLTGTAPTRIRVLVESIFGVTAQYGGLQIDPCVPESWTVFSVKRIYRGTEFVINFRNPDGISKGSVSLAVDGTAVDGNIVPLVYCDGGSHIVDAVMGPAR